MEDWQLRYLALKERVEVTSEAIDKLVLENNNLKSDNLALRSEIKTLTSQLFSLTAEHLKLKDKTSLTSKNSSIPTSKELYKHKNENKSKSDKKQGAQVGHKGHFRAKMEADEIVKINLDSLKCDCGGDIKMLDSSVHQKIDIPEIKPYVVDYHLARGRCKLCNKVTHKLVSESMNH